MLKCIAFCFLLLISNCAISQLAISQEKLENDTTHYNIYINSLEKISFQYPNTWDTTKLSNNYIFTAINRKSNLKSKFRSSLLWGKIEISESISLDSLLNSAATSLQGDNINISITNKEIKRNANNVKYAILKYLSSVNNLQISTTNIYFKKGSYGYYIVTGNTIDEEKRYRQIISKICDSIKFF